MPAKDLPAKAKEMAAAAAAKKAELTKSWEEMAAGLPKMVEAIKSRVDILSKSKKLPKGMDKATFEGAKAGSDFDVVFPEQACSHPDIVDPRGDAHGIQRPEPVFGSREHLEPHGFHARDERLAVALVPEPPALQTLLENDLERFAQGIVHQRGGGVVVDALGAPIFIDELDIQIPRLYALPAVADLLERTLRERHRR